MLRLWSCLFAAIAFAAASSRAQIEPDWSENARLASPRANPYGFSDEELRQRIRAGRLDALEYPVEISGTLIPWRPLEKFLDAPESNPLRILIRKAFDGLSGIRSSDDLFAKAGLVAYPETEGEGAYFVPFPDGRRPAVRMGATIFPKGNADAFTISCAACHAANLFGRRVIGLTNRFPRANEFFGTGKKAVSLVGPLPFQAVLGSTKEETDIYRGLREAVKSIGTRDPLVAGLDTSLAQVALSLAHRAPDAYASIDAKYQRRPQDEVLETYPADSKPAVWWNLKYKNRWFSDGSILSGNPILTSVIWNEIGRGTDLRALEDWFGRNPETIENLTTAVFSSEAPRYSDFFPAEGFDLAAAKRGETHFKALCAGCHGDYEKAWSLPGAESLPLVDQLRTERVAYGATRIRDVGTDPNRHLGMKSLETRLNPLAISKDLGILVRAQTGYVPPPLVGIWARWPYFHNNSAPSLCAVLTRAEDRPRSFAMGEANDPATDFDGDCNGYPLAERAPKDWQDRVYDTRREGMRNTGHDEGIFLENGKELLSGAEKRDLIRFLQTL